MREGSPSPFRCLKQIALIELLLGVLEKRIADFLMSGNSSQYEIPVVAECGYFTL